MGTQILLSVLDPKEQLDSCHKKYPNKIKYKPKLLGFYYPSTGIYSSLYARL